jgi:hypothetical protein
VAGETVLGGPYHITATLAPAVVLSNYNITNAGASFTINPRNATWTTQPNSKTYGDADPNPLTTGSGTNFIAADNVTATYSRTAGETVLGGPYHITATLAPTAVLSNYNITNTGASFTINARNASVTPNAASKTYGDADPAFTGTLINFVAADGVTATYSRTAGETVAGSPYTISAVLSPAAVLGNYNITYNTASFTINKRNASVTPNAASKTYGDADPAFTGTLTNFVAADGVTATYSRTAGETVAGSPYTISAVLSPAAVLGNYNITYNTASFTINQRTLHATPHGVNKVYDGLTTATVTFTDDRVSGDVFTYSYAANFADKNVGSSKPVVVTGISISGSAASNYVLASTTGSTTANITPEPASVTPNAASKIYGSPDPVLTGNLSGFVAADGITANYSRTAGETVAGSPYTISATLSPAGALGNYTITYSTANFTINQATTTVSLSVTPAANNGPGSYILNTPQTFSVTVTPQFTGTPTGTVTLKDGSTAIATIMLSAGAGSITNSTLVSAVLGAHSLVAVYNGDSNFIGNSSPVTSFNIGFAAGGMCDGDFGHQILQPINADGTSTFKQGSTVPAKFRVCDANGNSIGAPGTVTAFNLVSIISGTTTQTVDETVVSTTPDTSFRWDPTAQQWIFNISTKPLATHATYVYQINLADGSKIMFQYGLPK